MCWDYTSTTSASSGRDVHVRIYQTHERQTLSHRDSCDVVGLLCLREAARGGDSLLVSALTLFNEDAPNPAGLAAPPASHAHAARPAG